MKLNELRQLATVKNDKGIMRGFFSLVADNYDRMSKEELVTIIKELDYVVSEELGKGFNDIVEATLISIEEAEVFETEED